MNKILVITMFIITMFLSFMIGACSDNSPQAKKETPAPTIYPDNYDSTRIMFPYFNDVIYRKIEVDGKKYLVFQNGHGIFVLEVKENEKGN